MLKVTKMTLNANFCLCDGRLDEICYLLTRSNKWSMVIYSGAISTHTDIRQRWWFSIWVHCVMGKTENWWLADTRIWI